jgi:pimeloyl-ACP methyl ester carboxylesterase
MTIYLVPGLVSDEQVWRHQSAALADFGEVRIPVLREFSTLEGMARHILDGAPESFAIAGHSMGGRVALEVCRLAPERVARLALLDTGVHPAAPEEEGKRMALVDLARREGMAAMAKKWLPPMLHPAHMALYDALLPMICRYRPDQFENQQRALFTRPDAQPVLARVNGPALVLCGREDLWSPVKQHEEMAAAIRGAELSVIEQCGHMCTVEQPEAVTAAMRDWMIS